MKTICANRGKKFILIKLKDFYNKKHIIIKYLVTYMRKKNKVEV